MDFDECNTVKHFNFAATLFGDLEITAVFAGT